MRALILAGGFGTRLRSRLPGVPKALAPVGGRPFLAHQLDWLKAQGIDEAVIATHYLAEQIEAFAAELNGANIPLRVLREPKPLGTGGAIANAFQTLDGDDSLIVVNGDTHFAFALGPLIQRHAAAKTPVTLAIAHVGDTARYSTVELADGKVVSFRHATGDHAPGLVSCGAFMVDRAALRNAPPPPFSAETDLFPALVAGGLVAAHVVEGEEPFIDIGTADAYDAFRARMAPRALQPALLRQVISDHADLRGAMVALRETGRGIVFVADAEQRIVGVLTDGDVRNAVLERGMLQAPVTDHMTRDFVFVRDGTPKEEALKLIDSRIRAVPILDEARRLVDVVGGRLQPDAAPRLARARAPVRLSLAGGGTDFTNFFMRFGGVSLTASVAQYCHATMRRRDDRIITIYSHDLRTRAEAADIDALSYDGTLDLIKAGIKVLRPEFGFDLEIGSDFPPASGLGGSATILAATIGCLNEFREERLDNYTIAECAFEAERVELNIAGGWQDQYSTVFGGFNFIEFERDSNMVTPLRLAPATVNELEERLLFCHTGRAHLGAAIQEKNRELAEDEATATRYADTVKAVANAMKSRLLRGKLDDFGELLDETWRIKKSYRPEVTTEALDDIYRTARSNGAQGGRLLGTGGGGFFVFYTPPFARYRVVAALEEKGARTMNVTLDAEGLKSWTARS